MLFQSPIDPSSTKPAISDPHMAPAVFKAKSLPTICPGAPAFSAIRNKNGNMLPMATPGKKSTAIAVLNIDTR